MKNHLKHLPKIISALIIVALGMSCGGKGGDPTPVAPVTTLSKLAGDWKINTITRDGVDMSSFYAKFKLTFTKTGYTATGRPTPTPFQSSGALTIDDANKIMGLDLLSINFNFVSDKEVTLSFQYSGKGYTGDRVSEVSGNWSVDLEKQ